MPVRQIYDSRFTERHIAMKQNDFPTTMKYLLKKTIADDASVIRQIFTFSPGDFSRLRKMSLENFIEFLMRSEGGTVNSELINFYIGKPVKKISNSGFNQLRRKVNPEGLRFLLVDYVSRLSFTHRYKRKYTLVAVDGSDVNIPYDRSQTATFNPPDIEHYKGFNSIHLNALYNLSDKLYLDAAIGNGQKGKDERGAFYEMVDRYPRKLMPQTIFMADRGYSGYNSFAHVIENGGYFVFRVKDKDRKKSILAGFDLPDTDEFDVIVKRDLVQGCRTSTMQKQKSVYHYIHRNIRFDYIDAHKGGGLYYISLRITRIEVAPGEFECLISNLPMYDFSVDDLKDLYHRRWGIETSFLKLKYNIGLVNFHSRKLQYVLQEVYARMVMYNFCSIIASRICINKGHKSRRKHRYAVNFSNVVTVCRRFLDPVYNLSSADLESLIAGCVHAISPGRQQSRHIRGQHYVSFNNRIS